MNDQGVTVSHNTLRLLIGILGLTFPFLLVLGAWDRQTSISDYYYTNMRDYFEGVLFFLAVFLFCYRPYGADGWADNLLTNLAGAFALLLAFFPTVNLELAHVPTELVLNFIPLSWSLVFHNIGSGGLFVAFAALSLFAFTKGSKEGRTPGKVRRNAVYIVCGLGILGCIVWIGWQAVTVPDQKARDLLDIFYPEAIALVLFGFSWLTKGGVFLADKPSEAKATLQR